MDILRRSVLSATCALAFAPLASRVSFASVPARDGRRFVLIVLRGAMDGLGAVPPVGDPDYAAAHGALALTAADVPLPLDRGFALNPAMAPVHEMFGSGELTVVHAMASAYRSRSHFDGQNLLESGTVRPNGSPDGWLNRALTSLGAERWTALSVGPNVPFVLQGAFPVGNWHPDRERAAGAGMLLAVSRMYETDPALGRALEEGIRTGDMVGEAAAAGGRGASFADLAGTTGRTMAAPQGPNVAVMELGGWDTHVGQGTSKGRLAAALGQLARGMANLKQGLGEHWSTTAVVAVTEFGRTVGPNGTGGTDHGTASAGFLAGGAVAGGKVLGEWPGLSKAALYEGRDLAPATDMRSLLKGVLGDHLRMTARDLDAKVFPDSGSAKPMHGLMRA